MSRNILIIQLLFLTVCVNSQTVINLDTISVMHPLNGNTVKSLFSDSLSSSFCIIIPSEVKAHKHMHHSEQVYVLEGTGEMKLVDKTFRINKGDIIFIPKNTVHAVKKLGETALKVISVQSPYFDGTDRVMVSEKN